MSAQSIPVYDIEHFRFIGNEKDFYANTVQNQLKQNQDMILWPHRHSFFACEFFTKGSGIHQIDFNTYEIKPGTVFTLSPGQVHTWELSEDIDGYIFFHTGDFFNINYTFEKVEHFPFFSINNSPVIFIENHPGIYAKIENIYREIIEEYQKEGEVYKPQKLYKLANLVYIELLRVYLSQKVISVQDNNYLAKVRQLEDLIEKNFKEVKSPKEYAAMMNISDKHLNRISKEILNKTISDLIFDRIILEAKRMLVHSTYSVSEIAANLGYTDISYFFRLFKKRTGETPLTFIKKFRKE